MAPRSSADGGRDSGGAQTAPRVALVGLPSDSLDLIVQVRKSGRGEVSLLADPDPAASSHALAAVFQVPSTRGIL